MAIAAPTLPSHRYSVFHRWHLLSLDAPTVAAVWTLAAARITHQHLSLFVPAAMFTAVWLLYVADRVLDHRQGHDLEARHRFHGKHRLHFGLYAIVATTLLGLFTAMMPFSLLLRYLILCSPLALYFAAIHFTRWRHHAPKELIVGLFFAAAVFLPELFTPRVAVATTFFAALCWLNCVAIHRWENPHERTWPARNFRALVLILSLLACITPLSPAPHPFILLNLCCAMSSLLLLALDLTRKPISSVTLRTAADAALLTPVILLLFR